MSTTYVHKQSSAQKKDAPSASSVLDASSQSESLQRKADMANNAAQRAEAPRPNNTGMPDNLKAGIESLSGFSMDDVRVHYNSSKPATVQALAYTQGTDIHVAPGQEKHLPHEAWHVAQQMAGRVSPTTNINGMPVNDNAALEHEADVMGEKAESVNDEIEKKISNIETIKSNKVYQAKFYEKIWNSENKKLEYKWHKEDAKDDDYIKLYEKKKHFINEYPVYVNKTYKSLNVLFAEMIDNKRNQLSTCLITNKLLNETNTETLKKKYFSSSPGALISDSPEKIDTEVWEKFKQMMNSVGENIERTVFDINYWIGKKNIEEDEITDISLTDSDVHTRGIGVCIISYQKKGEEKTQKWVFKPEDKSLERAIYGKEDSLATMFDKIGTLEINTEKEKGSLVEYVEHKAKHKAKPLKSSDELITLIKFASILGLADLHKENLVENNEEKPQLIDAEVALSYEFENMASSLDKGDMLDVVDDMKKLKSDLNAVRFRNLDIKAINVLNEAKKKLSGLRSRIVPIETVTLYSFRAKAYLGEFNDKTKSPGPENLTYEGELKHGLSTKMGLEDISIGNCNDLISETEKIFWEGKIPMFEYIFNDGSIILKKSDNTDLLIYQNNDLKLDNVINKRIKRIVNYIEDELAKKQAYQQWEEQEKGDRTKEWTDANYYKALEFIRKNLDEQAKVNAYYKWMKEGQPNSSQEEDFRRYIEGRNQALFDMWCSR